MHCSLEPLLLLIVWGVAFRTVSDARPRRSFPRKVSLSMDAPSIRARHACPSPGSAPRFHAQAALAWNG